MTQCTFQMRDDPAAFLGRIGSRPFHINDPTFTPAVKRHVDNGTPHELLKIMGRDRIAYAKVQFNATTLRFEADILPTAAQGAAACYWLPWKKDSALQIKLMPSKKQTLAQLPGTMLATRSAADSTSLTIDANAQWVDRGIEGEDPQLFFTGMMNGCSLFVSGDAREPRVYHVNRASFSEERTEELLTSNKDRDSDLNSLKTNRMVKDFQRFDNTNFSRLFAKTAYVTPSSQHRRNPLGNKAQDNATRERSALIRRLINDTNNYNYRIAQHWVTAFGIRIQTKWRFYKQDVYVYSRSDDYGNAIANTKGVTASAVTRFF
jgi:hypothetical protein